MLWNPALAGAFAQLRGVATGDYLVPPSYLDAVARFETSQVDPDDLYVGDWTQLLVGIRTDLRFSIRVLDQRYADELMIGLLTYLRADVQLAHPEALAVAIGPTT
jgi:HK97 family phage major capsid protein